MIEYINISTKTLRKKEFSPMETILISLLGVLTVKGKQVSKSTDRYIADVLGVSRIHVNRMLAKLKKLGIISTSMSYGQREIKLLRKDFLYKKKKKEEVNE
jgi:CRP-like cAMP-binding protein